jgi:hypothetical protein
LGDLPTGVILLLASRDYSSRFARPLVRRANCTRLGSAPSARRLARGVHPPRGAEGFVEKVRSDDLEVAAKLKIEERELDAGGLN